MFCAQRLFFAQHTTPFGERFLPPDFGMTKKNEKSENRRIQKKHRVKNVFNKNLPKAEIAKSCELPKSSDLKLFNLLNGLANKWVAKNRDDPSSSPGAGVTKDINLPQ